MLDNAGVSKTEDGISTKVSYGLCELKIFFVLVTRRLMIIVTIKLIRSQLAGRLTRSQQGNGKVAGVFHAKLATEDLYSCYKMMS
jgi:hypothetical protein